MDHARALPVLMYHHVGPRPGLVTVSPASFRAHMAWIAANGWRTVGCDDLAGFIAGSSLPAKSVLLTFDDGYLDNYVHAWPVLREFGLHAAIFLVTGWLGDGPVRCPAGAGETPDCPDHRGCKVAIAAGDADRVMLRWSEVAAMGRDGTCEFHSHTDSHRRWDRELTDRAARRAALAEDLGVSRRRLGERLGERLGSASPHLCWPQGYYDDDYLATARAAGFTHCYTTETGVVRGHSDALRIPRIVAKEAPAAWLGRRLRLFTAPLLGDLYARWRRT